MKREKELAKNTLILSIGSFLPKFTALITVPIITGNLTKVEYGTYDLITTLVSLLLPVVTLQIQTAAFRFLIDCRNIEIEKKRVISNIYFFLIPISFITLIILYFALYKLNWQTRILIVIYFLVDIFLKTTQQIVRGLSYNKLFSISAVVQSVTNMMLIVLTVQGANQGLNGVLISFIGATSLGIILLVAKGGIIKEIDFSLYSWSTIKKMLLYSWPMIPNTLSGWVLSTSDRLVLTAFMGLEAVATYGAANKIPALLVTVQGTFVFAWQENASLALNDSDVENYYTKMYDRIYCLVAGILAVLIGATPLLFRFLIRGDYADAYPQMPILFMGMFFNTISSFLGGIYVAHKRTKSVGLTTMLAAACNLIIDFALVRRVGIYAASISTLISYMLLAIYRMYDVRSFQTITYKYKKIAFTLAALVGMCILCWINIKPLNIANFIIGCAYAVLLNRMLIVSIWEGNKSKMKKGKS